MKLPTSKQLGELSQSDRELLGKFYDTFSSCPWFESAMIVCSHPETLAEKTLEVHCLYHSSFSHPSMKHFAKENGLALYTVLPRDADERAFNRNNPLNSEITIKEISTLNTW